MGSKKLWLPLLLLLFAALVVWIGLKRSQPAAAGGGIAVILQTKDVNSSYWQTVRSGALAAAKELNVALELLGPSGAEAAQEQKELLRKAIAARPDAIVLAPISEERLSEELAACRKAGIKLIVIDTPLLQHPYDSYVSSDHVEEGRVAADMLAPDKRKKPVYAFITSDDDLSWRASAARACWRGSRRARRSASVRSTSASPRSRRIGRSSRSRSPIPA